MKERLGNEAWKTLIEETQKGSITSQHMKDISRAFGSKVGGNHARRTNDQKVNCDDHELREILSDWWNEELFNLSPENALKRICEILKSSEVHLPAIASKLMSSRIMNPQDVILAAIEGMAPNMPSLIERIKKIFESIREKELRGLQTAEDAAEAYRYIDQQFEVIVKLFKQNRDYAHYTIEEVEDRIAGSFEIEIVNRFVLKEQPEQEKDRILQVRQLLGEVKDSRLKLLLIQILLNPNKRRRVKQVISEYNAHIASYDLLEKNISLQEKNRKSELEFQRKEKEFQQEKQRREELEMKEKERKERKEKKRKEKEERRKNEEQRREKEKEEERKLRREEEEERIKEDLTKRQREENIKKSEDEERRKRLEIKNAGGVW